MGKQNMTSRISKHPSQRTSEKGFSLIEISFALLLIGILVVPIIRSYDYYIQNRANTVTASATKVVAMGLMKYVAKHGHYPFPATRNLPQGNAGFGVPAVKPGTGWPACTAGSTAVCRTNTNGFATLPAADRFVLIGDVPLTALGIPYKATLDGYGNKLTYMVTETMTPGGVYSETGGAIEVIDVGNAAFYAGTTQRAHYAIISHGKDARGAFSLDGVLIANCGTVANSTDFENCNGDARVRNNYNAAAGRTDRYSGAGATHFDDVVEVNNVSSSGIWSNEPSTASIRTNLGGNIFIGPVTGPSATMCPYPCIPKSRVEVQGDVRADTVETVRLCNRDSAACTSQEVNASGVPDASWGTAKPVWGSPTLLGGVPPGPYSAVDPATQTKWDATNERHLGQGIRCNGDRGLNGITDYDEVCADTAYFAPSVNLVNCASGYYPNGLKSDGTLNCVLP